MDLDVIEGLNEVVPAVYRAAFKLRSLQNLCQMHVVRLSAIGPALHRLGVAVGPGGGVTEAEMGRSLGQLFRGVSAELPARSPGRRRADLQTPLQAVRPLAERCSGRQGRESGTVSRSGLRALLEDLSQIPAVVQESHVFGAVESAVRTCFQGVLSAGVSEEGFLRWLRSEPRLLLWLSTLYRLSVSEAVLHRVRCHVCKAFPITGLRYRCLKCVNVHLCQTCFLTHKRSRKHKPSHPVMEHCTQPSFRESLTSLAHSARHTLMRRRLARREAERRSALCTEIPPRMPCSAPTAPSPGSKGLQTDTALQPQRKTSLLKKDLSQTRMAVRDLQREKWQLEKQLQAWRETVESEHSSLEDKCCHLEATVEVLTQHNQNLQDELAQIRLLVQPLYVIPVPGVSLATVSGEGAGDSETWESEREQTAGERPLQEEEAPTEVQVSESEEEPKATQTPGAGDADPQCGGDPAHSPQQEEDQGYAGKALVDRSESLLEQEEELGDLVLHLKSALAVDRCTGAGSVQTQELLAAAEAVEDSVSQLVCAVSSYALASQPRPPHGPALSTNQAAALSQLRSHCTQWASARSCSRSQSTAQTHSTAAGRPLWASGHQKRKV
ncbi:hypothetical protein COCON_G00194980 [Conger conger]|uniref:ZZ-type domain-containing protein n=1 Tax=Conger conger TaxID=82655 RepID=A0A9Q1HQP2_CONCO|nr:hypothetical protein COCON_G00194980 [Conger conger]